MLVIEAQKMKRQLEDDIRQLIASFENTTSLIVTAIYVNRVSTVETGRGRTNILNSIECEVQLQ